MSCPPTGAGPATAGPSRSRRHRHGRRGGHDRLVRRGGRGRPRHRHADAGGPARQAAYVPARAGLPARGQAGHPHPPRARWCPGRTHAYGVRAPSRCTAAKARVARASRIFVEGRHDAELVEKVWGDDLRIEGVVVEYLGGVDDLADHLRDFKPGPQRRVGVLVDHLVPGSKESRIAQGIARSPIGKHVLVVGHPFIDIWQAVKPDRLGIAAWPAVPRSIDWKTGTCQQLGWPHRDQADIARAWKHILGRVTLLRRPRPRPAGPCRGAHRLHDGGLRAPVGIPAGSVDEIADDGVREEAASLGQHQPLGAELDQALLRPAGPRGSVRSPRARRPGAPRRGGSRGGCARPSGHGSRAPRAPRPGRPRGPGVRRTARGA